MQASPFLVEMERLPTQYFERSRDWSDLAISRVLAEPLFVEQPQRGLSSAIVHYLKKIDDRTWHLELADLAENCLEGISTALAVCSQIQASRKHAAAPAIPASMMKSLRMISDRKLEIETRLPLAHLDRILANPGLTPHRLEALNHYSVERASPTKIHLRSTRSRRAIELTQATGNHSKYNSDTPMRGPMALEPKTLNIRIQANVCAFELDICYALLCPPSASRSLVSLIEENLDRDRAIKSLGDIIAPCKRLVDTWQPEAIMSGSIQPIRNHEIEYQAAALHYSDFPGNAALAMCLSRALRDQFGLNLSPQETPYDLLHPYGRIVADIVDFRLVVVASPWPHPLAQLATYYFSKNSSDEFKAAFRDAAREQNLDFAIALAARAEDILIKDGRPLIVVGRALGHTWPVPRTFNCPPSGWIDLEALSESGDTRCGFPT